MAEACYAAGVRIECPMCHRVIENAQDDHPARPFCSPRCKLADLDNWLNERYRASRPASSSDGSDFDDDERPLN